MKKRGQFFLIMAVVIGALLLGATGLYNQSRTSSISDRFNLLCENYYYEVQQLNKDFIVEKGQAIPLSLSFPQEVEEFTNFFEQEYEVEIEIKEATEEYNSFHFEMTQEKDREIYKCIK